MTVRLWTVCTGVLAAGALAFTAWAQGPNVPDTRGIFDQADVLRNGDLPPGPAGVEPLARGPVHEAFVEFARVKFTAGPVILREPPALIEEMPPAEKPDDDDAQWICGYWGWDEEREDFLWVSGVWRVPPPDRQWVPGHWSHVDGGWQWVPGFWAPGEDGDVEVFPAPPDFPPPGEAIPPPPTADSTYVPGCYVPHNNSYAWRPGQYVENRPGWVYVPPHYSPCPTGYIFVEGYWDFALNSRGLLFAPAYISVEYRNRPGYVYTPSYVVHDQALIGALFVRQDVGYYFGDYFGARYQQAGYTSFTEVRVGNGYDPLFSYYRFENRANLGWERELVGLYAGRRLGSIPPPPRTLAQQQALAVSFRNGNSSLSFGVMRQSVMLAPVNRVNTNVVAIQKLKQEQLVVHAKQVKGQQEMVQQRKEAQAKMIVQAREVKAKQVQNRAEAVVNLQQNRAEAVVKQQQAAQKMKLDLARRQQEAAQDRVAAQAKAAAQVREAAQDRAAAQAKAAAQAREAVQDRAAAQAKAAAEARAAAQKAAAARKMPPPRPALKLQEAPRPAAQEPAPKRPLPGNNPPAKKKKPT